MFGQNNARYLSYQAYIIAYLIPLYPKKNAGMAGTQEVFRRRTVPEGAGLKSRAGERPSACADGSGVSREQRCWRSAPGRRTPSEARPGWQAQIQIIPLGEGEDEE
jgi:hypothetical protein